MLHKLTNKAKQLVTNFRNSRFVEDFAQRLVNTFRDLALNLYIVDDDPTYYEDLTKTLNEAIRIEATHFSSGEEFIAHIQSSKLDRDQIYVAIVSHSFPIGREVRHGLEVVKSIVEETPLLALILLSKDDEMLYAMKGMRAGAISVVAQDNTLIPHITSSIIQYASRVRAKIRWRQLVYAIMVACLWLALSVMAILLSALLIQPAPPAPPTPAQEQLRQRLEERQRDRAAKQSSESESTTTLPNIRDE